VTEAVRIMLTAGEPAGIGPDICLEWALSGGSMMLLSWPMPRCCVSGRNFSNWTSPSRWVPDQPISRTGDAFGVVGRPGREVPAGCAEQRQRPICAQDPGSRCRGPASSISPRRWLLRPCIRASSINQAGIVFSGHTEFLQEKCGAGGVVMMLATEGLRVALATTHMPLRDVPDAITGDRLSKVIRILDKDLKHHFGITQPRILVAGLNPPCGRRWAPGAGGDRRD